MSTKRREPYKDWEEWAKRQDSLKTQWVVAVMAFWITVAILVLVFVLEQKFNPILISIALGTMFLGVWLKARFRLHQYKEPAHKGDDDDQV